MGGGRVVGVEEGVERAVLDVHQQSSTSHADACLDRVADAGDGIAGAETGGGGEKSHVEEFVAVAGLKK